MVNRKAMSPFEKTMVNKCHAKRDTKTCSITYHSSLPGPYYYYWPGNPVIKPFGVAELLIIAASPRLDSRLPARMTAGRMRSQTFYSRLLLASQLAFVLSIHHCLSFVIARPILLLAGQSRAAKPSVCVWQSRMLKRVTLRVTDI